MALQNGTREIADNAKVRKALQHANNVPLMAIIGGLSEPRLPRVHYRTGCSGLFLRGAST
jgi:hypothetical protein